MFAVAIESEKIGEIGPSVCNALDITQGQLELAFRLGETFSLVIRFYELRTFGERQKCHVVTRDASDTL
jgi:hypothetical protein